MKILHINYSDVNGGAAIAAFRHHEAMRLAGIDSKMLVIDKRSNDSNIIQYKKSRFNKIWGKLIDRLVMKILNYYASWSWAKFGYDISKHPVVKEADVVYLHWINGFMISYREIENLLKSGKTVYWFMHDMWPITGGCHYSLECSKYTNQCSKCPMTFNKKGSYLIHDLSYYQFNAKKNWDKYSNLHFLTPSNWLTECVRKSSIFCSHDIQVARNVINTNLFKLRDKSKARERLGLPLDKKLILFGADSINRPYKGWSTFKGALKDPIACSVCVLYGKSTDDIANQIGMPVYMMGMINNNDKLIDLYNACDILVIPSIADNYPNVIIEAMACGLPVVGADVGGIPEMINDGESGIIVKNPNPTSYRDAIINALNKKDKFNSVIIRNKIIKNNSYQTILKQHPFLQKTNS